MASRGRRKGMALARSAGIRWTAPAFVIHDADSFLDAPSPRVPCADDDGVNLAGLVLVFFRSADW